MSPMCRPAIFTARASGRRRVPAQARQGTCRTQVHHVHTAAGARAECCQPLDRAQFGRLGPCREELLEGAWVVSGRWNGGCEEFSVGQDAFAEGCHRSHRDLQLPRPERGKLLETGVAEEALEGGCAGA